MFSYCGFYLKLAKFSKETGKTLLQNLLSYLFGPILFANEGFISTKIQIP